MTVTENGATYQLVEILNVQVYVMTVKTTVVTCKSPFNNQSIGYYADGRNCVTMDKLGNKFGARYDRNGKYFARAAKPIK